MEATGESDSAPDMEAADTLVLSGFKPGAVFADHYRIEALLGSGSMGKVFRATDMALGQDVALKVLHPEKAKREHVVVRFRREAEILAALGHEGIVKLHEFGQAADGTFFLAMEHLRGRTLRERLAADGPLSPEEFLPIAVATADALGAAHVSGVVHRDLKPDNIFLSQDEGRIKVLDFGLSLLDTGVRTTKTGTILGTPRYMAPEQIRSAKDVDPRTDVYALGITAHESLCGASPFPASDPGQLLGCVVEGRILELEAQNPSVPTAVAQVVRRAMARDPQDRYGTVGAFAEAFAGALGTTTGRSQLVEPTLNIDEGSETGADELDPDLFRQPEAEEPAPPAPAPTSVREPMPMHSDAPPRFSSPSLPPQRDKSTLMKWGAFFLAVIVVACLSGSFAYGLRTYLLSRASDASQSVRSVR